MEFSENQLSYNIFNLKYYSLESGKYFRITHNSISNGVFSIMADFRRIPVFREVGLTKLILPSLCLVWSTEVWLTILLT